MSDYRSRMAGKRRLYRTILFEGFEILVGRGEDDNDHLTFDVAKSHDLWLHVGGGTAGTHVVVRNPEKAVVPAVVIERAAALAAWYSKAHAAPRRHMKEGGRPDRSDCVVMSRRQKLADNRHYGIIVIDANRHGGPSLTVRAR
jgi:hypothetical protein